MIILRKGLVHFSVGSEVSENGVASTGKSLRGDINTTASVTGASSDASGVTGTCTSLLALKLLELVVLLEEVCPFVDFNKTPTSVTGASSDASGVTGDFPLDLGNWN